MQTFCSSLAGRNRYRYYDSTRGKWLSRDPIGESGGYNLTGTGNDFVNGIDELGLLKDLGRGRWKKEEWEKNYYRFTATGEMERGFLVEREFHSRSDRLMMGKTGRGVSFKSHTSNVKRVYEWRSVNPNSVPMGYVILSGLMQGLTEGGHRQTYNHLRKLLKSEQFRRELIEALSEMSPEDWARTVPAGLKASARNYKTSSASLGEAAAYLSEEQYGRAQNTYAKSAGVLGGEVVMELLRRLSRLRKILAVNKHHALPKFLGGHTKQITTKLPANVHKEFHRALRANLRKKGLPLNVGGKGGSSADWARYMNANPGAQRRAFDAVLDSSRHIDMRYGTTITQDVWKNVIKANFTPMH